MLSVNIRELPDCSCTRAKLLPVEDVSKDGVIYLKGWFCPVCNTSWLLYSGTVVEKQINRTE